jgi:hypothetical protein
MPMSGVTVLAVSPGGHLGGGGDDAPYRGGEPGGVVVAGTAGVFLVRTGRGIARSAALLSGPMTG